MWGITSYFKRVHWALLFVFVLAGAMPAWSQNCALCYTQAAQSTTRFIQALRSGILILVIPPTFMSVGFTVIAYRKRHRYHTDRVEKNDGW